MNQEKVQIVQTQFVHGFFKGTPGQVIAVICIPQLGRDKQILPGNAAQADCLADAFLISVSLRRVDVCTPQENETLASFRIKRFMVY